MGDLQGNTILVIDDHPPILRMLEHTLCQAGAWVYTASNGPEGLRLLQAHRPDLVVLDVMMPHMDGWEVCSRIRQFSDVPIIFLSALDRDEESLRRLNCGAIDYFSKPTNPDVLVDRARAALRQAKLNGVSEKPPTYRDDYLTIDLDRRRLLVSGRTVRLSPLESHLLAYLLRNAGVLLSAQHILDNVWGFEYLGSAKYVHAYIWQLSQKLERNPKHPRYLLTEPGLGYRFQPSLP